MPVYNLVPFQGVPSMVAFPTEAGPTFIVGSLSPVDQHVTFTISDIHAPPAGPPPSPPIIGSRLVFFGGKSPTRQRSTRPLNGTYLTMPSNCAGGQVVETACRISRTAARADCQQTPNRYTTPTGATGCDAVPFKPTIDVGTTGGRP